MTANDDRKTPFSSAREGGGESGEGEERAAARPSADAADELEALRRELEEKAAEAARLEDLYRRERAELENFKRRQQREGAEALRYAIAPLVRELLPVIDNLERAVEHAESDGNGQSLVEGVRLVLKSAVDILERHGVTRVDATGERFDPSRHEAIAQVASSEVEPQHVVQQFLPGYSLHDRLLRAAQVSVSAKPPVEKQEGDD